MSPCAVAGYRRRMPTIIVFNGSKSITVTEEPDAVAAALRTGWAHLTQVGPTPVVVNGDSVAYIQDVPT
ncbi:MAG: hypothetical protein QOE31_1588 [Solirubrobacteraceae bacterium]|nr:hypothetical protein [Solirubrobacteraceae bacterium]